ncbi:Ig-like domain-containing protein [Chromobacterium piscinae]|uniref:Ig-like domain-containing protein n=1 Tax=Chromobacterium piscinae TaxID=686831 RepID=UPI001E2B01C9|nr:Ig-like domain-containing protein [Chromobacterium piscinae]MCD4506935.1 Ig-like domain-containing protein [Chromobacterium piscinae]
MQWLDIPVEVGQTLRAVYQFNNLLRQDLADQSRYLYDYAGRETAARVAAEGRMVEKSGEVPGRVLTIEDAGKTIELSVQARSRLAVGNVLTIDSNEMGKKTSGNFQNNEDMPIIDVNAKPLRANGLWFYKMSAEPMTWNAAEGICEANGLIFPNSSQLLAASKVYGHFGQSTGWQEARYWTSSQADNGNYLSVNFNSGTVSSSTLYGNLVCASSDLPDSIDVQNMLNGISTDITMTGEVKVGTVLQAKAGALKLYGVSSTSGLSTADLADIRYRWKRGEDILQEGSSESYEIKPGDHGQAITVELEVGLKQTKHVVASKVSGLVTIDSTMLSPIKLTVRKDNQVADGDARNEVQIVVTDKNGQVVPNVRVIVNADSGTIHGLTAGSFITTDKNGIANVTLTNIKPGVTNLTAKVDGGAVSTAPTLFSAYTYPVLTAGGRGFHSVSGHELMNFSQAKQACQDKNMVLPTKDQLLELYRNYPNNEIGKKYKWRSATPYWTSTINSPNRGYVRVYLGTGGVDLTYNDPSGNSGRLSPVACVDREGGEVPVNLGAISINVILNGKAEKGERLTAQLTNAQLNGLPQDEVQYYYKWKRGNAIIDGESSHGYVVQEQDKGHKITVEVELEYKGLRRLVGSVTTDLVADPEQAIQALNAITGELELTGKAKVGGALTATLVNLQLGSINSKDVNVYYKWRNGNITGVSTQDIGLPNGRPASTSYTAQSKDLGHQIIIEVVLEYKGQRRVFGSLKSDVVIPSDAQQLDAITTEVELVGEARLGNKLMVKLVSLQLNGVPEKDVIVHYKWGNDVEDSGPRNTKKYGINDAGVYYVTAKDHGRQVKVEVVLELNGERRKVGSASSDFVPTIQEQLSEVSGDIRLTGVAVEGGELGVDLKGLKLNGIPKEDIFVHYAWKDELGFGMTVETTLESEETYLIRKGLVGRVSVEVMLEYRGQLRSMGILKSSPVLNKKQIQAELNAITGEIKLTGEAKVGSQLTAKLANLQLNEIAGEDVTIRYKWRNSVGNMLHEGNFGDASDPSSPYLVADSDRGRSIIVEVELEYKGMRRIIATQSTGNVPTQVQEQVQEQLNAVTANFKLTGEATVGSVLTTKLENLQLNGIPESDVIYRYTWRDRNGAFIMMEEFTRAAQASSYIVRNIDNGHSVSAHIEIEYKGQRHSVSTQVSNVIRSVTLNPAQEAQAGLNAITGELNLVGEIKVGSKLKASLDKLQFNGLSEYDVFYRYKWKGAADRILFIDEGYAKEASSYTVKSVDYGRPITVEVEMVYRYQSRRFGSKTLNAISAEPVVSAEQAQEKLNAITGGVSLDGVYKVGGQLKIKLDDLKLNGIPAADVRYRYKWWNGTSYFPGEEQFVFMVRPQHRNKLVMGMVEIEYKGKTRSFSTGASWVR